MGISRPKVVSGLARVPQVSGIVRFQLSSPRHVCLTLESTTPEQNWAWYRPLDLYFPGCLDFLWLVWEQGALPRVLPIGSCSFQCLLLGNNRVRLPVLTWRSLQGCPTEQGLSLPRPCPAPDSSCLALFFREVPQILGQKAKSDQVFLFSR